MNTSFGEEKGTGRLVALSSLVLAVRDPVHLQHYEYMPIQIY